MQTQTQEADDPTQVPLDKKKEEKIHEILLLLESLSYREETSIKLIIDSLYDIASVNLIDQKFRSRSLKGGLKLIARVSKPAFRIIAWRWYKKNCPQLIVNWLRRKVAFEPTVRVKQEAKLEPELVSELHRVKTDSLVQLENQTREVRYLRSQVRILISVLVGLTVVFGGTVVWFGYSLERYNLQTTKQAKEASTGKPFASSKDN
ncbi:MAG: hypothetical protein AAF915_12115 [Cyanobacteria bacterium P01_D01_bin.50]